MKKSLLMLAIAAFIGVMGTGCAQVVDAGNKGVSVRLGEVNPVAMDSGFYFYNPFTTDIHELSVQEQKWSEKTESFSQDAQVVHVSFSLNWQPVPSKVAELYRDKGADYQNVLIPQVVYQHLKEVIGKYKATDLIASREAVRTEIKGKLVAELKTKDINVIDFAINDIDYNPAFKEAVEAKVVAVQHAEEAKNHTVQVREEASQKVIAATAEANSMRIRAQALAQNEKLVAYEALSVQREAIQKWDGKLPEQMLGNSMPFLDVAAARK